MLRLSLAQMRRSAGRLVAAGIAIAIGTAFVAAAFFGGSVINTTTAKALTASIGDADLVVSGWDSTPALAKKIEKVDGVESVFAQVQSFEEVNFQGRHEYTLINTPAPNSDLSVIGVEEGNMPENLDEIALPQGTMDRLNIKVGDQITIPVWNYTETEDGGYSEETSERTLTVTGITNDPSGAFISYGGGALVTPETQNELLDGDRDEYSAENITITLASGASVDTVKADIEKLVDPDSEISVRTAAEQVDYATKQVTGDTNVLLIVVLSFAVVALFVAGLVITNTFQVLIAQRTRQLALLRCVGATRSQVSRSVTLESLILGFLASLAGLALGAALIQGTLAVLSRSDIGVPLPDAIDLSLTNILVPIITGTVVTVLAAISPARAATRVAPLAALRPADAPDVRTKAGTFRLVISLLGMIGGAIFLVGGVFLAKQEPMLGFLVAVLGGMASFIGIIIGGVFVVPKVVGLFGNIAGRLTGATAKIATANTVRNPRRTAATATALLIGVTLVTMMSTGAAIARTTLNSALTTQFPVDIAVGEVTTDSDVVNPRIAAEMAKLDGVKDVAEIQAADVTVVVTDGGGVIASSGTEMVATTIDHAARAGAIATTDSVPVDEGTVLIGQAYTYEFGLNTDDPAKTITIVGPSGEKTLKVAGKTTHIGAGVALNADDFESVVGTADVHAVWMSVDDSQPAINTYSNVTERVSELTEGTESSYMISGSAAERAMFEQVIDTLLLIVVGLLAVAVVIALIGVANTLSLSVIERRRESALLRALGLTRGRLRLMLAIEAVLITGVGALLGVILGLIYGFAGGSVIFGSMTGGGVAMTVPWRDIALVLGVALAAGLLASVMPARSATKTSPVAALAEE